MFVNWVPEETSDGVRLVATKIAQWEEGAAGITRYEFDDKSAPAWAGGVLGWDAVPGDGSACAPGHVFSLASLQCELCPAGTFQDASNCALCSRGYHAPGPGHLECLPCLQSGYAEREGMTACTPCARNHEMRGGARASASDADCVCRQGYTAGCSWPVWQVACAREREREKARERERASKTKQDRARQSERQIKRQSETARARQTDRASEQDRDGDGDGARELERARES